MNNDPFERKMNNSKMERLYSSNNRAVLKRTALENSIENQSRLIKELSFIQTPVILKGDYKTPMIKKNDRTFDDVEMRKTRKNKPPLMSSKLPPAFGLSKKSFLDQKTILIEETSANLSIIKHKTPINKESKGDQLKLGSYKKKIIKKLVDMQKLDCGDRMDDQRKTSKIILKPIEIKDPRKNVSKDVSREKQQRPISKNLQKNSTDKNVERVLNKFAKTTIDFNFKKYKTELKTEINQEHVTTNAVTNISAISEIKYRIEDMFTLSMLNSSHTLGTVKKMINSHNLKVYVIKEVPLVSKEVRTEISDYLNSWQKIRDNSFLTEVFKEFINTPEGSTSLMLEYMNNGSLKKLINVTGRMNESCLKTITIGLVNALEAYQKFTNRSYGPIYPSQVLFNSNGKVKLGLNLKEIYYRNMSSFKDLYKNGLFYSNYKKFDSKFSDIKIIAKLKAKVSQTRKKEEDIFYLGYLLLQASLGFQDIVDFSKYDCLHEYKCCCLLHCVECSESKKNTDKSMWKTSSFINEKVFSKEFLDFLCLSTSFSIFSSSEQNKNPSNLTVTKLRKHPFINEVYNPSERPVQSVIALQEMLLLTKDNPSSFKKNRERINHKKFSSFCDSILMLFHSMYDNAKVREISKDVLSQLNHSNEGIEEVCREFDLDRDVVLERFSQIYSIESLIPKSTIDY